MTPTAATSRPSVSRLSGRTPGGRAAVATAPANAMTTISASNP